MAFKYNSAELQAKKEMVSSGLPFYKGAALNTFIFGGLFSGGCTIARYRETMVDGTGFDSDTSALDDYASWAGYASAAGLVIGIALIALSRLPSVQEREHDRLVGILERINESPPR